VPILRSREAFADPMAGEQKRAPIVQVLTLKVE
jgi:hypothetical protein